MSAIITLLKQQTGVIKMITFYCVGFPDLDRSWNYYGHVQHHEIYMKKEDAEKEAEGKVVSVYEFHARNQAQIDELVRQNRVMLERFS